MASVSRDPSGCYRLWRLPDNIAKIAKLLWELGNLGNLGNLRLTPRARVPGDLVAAINAERGVSTDSGDTLPRLSRISRNDSENSPPDREADEWPVRRRRS